LKSCLAAILLIDSEEGVGGTEREKKLFIKTVLRLLLLLCVFVELFVRDERLY
jgi:hypothetical protein